MRARATDKKPARKEPQWGEEFKEFRSTYNYGQRELAGLLNCCKRTINAVENQEVRNPNHELQRRFHMLRYKHETERQLQEAERARAAAGAQGRRRGPVPISHLFRDMPVGA